MRALRYHSYGPPDVLRIDELPEPSPGAGQVKVRVQAVGSQSARLEDPRRPRAPDSDLPVAAARNGHRFRGRDRRRRRKGRARDGSASAFSARSQPFGREGALADYLVVSDDRVLPIPQDLDAGEAAALPVAGGTALQALTDEAHVGPGQRVLITGAAGGVGHFAVQIAKHLGAYVVAVCSAGNAAFVRELGADEVVDYAHDDYTRRTDRFDVVFDAASASTFAAASPVLDYVGRLHQYQRHTRPRSSAPWRPPCWRASPRASARSRSRCANDARIWQRLLQLVRERAIARRTSSARSRWKTWPRPSVRWKRATAEARSSCAWAEPFPAPRRGTRPHHAARLRRAGDRGGAERSSAALRRAASHGAARAVEARRGMTLGATTLLHEAYLDISDREGSRFPIATASWPTRRG